MTRVLKIERNIEEKKIQEQEKKLQEQRESIEVEKPAKAKKKNKTKEFLEEIEKRKKEMKEKSMNIKRTNASDIAELKVKKMENSILTASIGELIQAKKDEKTKQVG